MFRKICLLAFAVLTLSLVSADVHAKGGGKGGHGKGGQGGGHRGGQRSVGPRSTHRVRSQTHKPTYPRTHKQTYREAHERTHGPNRSISRGPSKLDHRSSGPRHQRLAESSVDHSHTGASGEHSDTGATTEHDKWRLKEDRKLEHRRQVAEHLRQVADRNGNQNLRDVADRMDQKAQEHYDKQIRKRYGDEIADEPPAGEVPEDELPVDESPADEFPGDESLTGESPTDGTPEEIPDAGEEFPPSRKKLTGRQNALYRQWRNEERKLAKSLAAAERLREMAETSGDPSLLQSAERIEQAALDRYTSRMEKVWDFQDRFGLPTPEEFVTSPTPEEMITLPTSVEP